MIQNDSEYFIWTTNVESDMISFLWFLAMCLIYMEFKMIVIEIFEAIKFNKISFRENTKINFYFSVKCVATQRVLWKGKLKIIFNWNVVIDNDVVEYF